MWPYYLIIIYIFIVVGFVLPKIGDKNKYKYLFMIIPLFLFAAIRGNGKGDYFAYIDRGAKIKNIYDILYDNYAGMEIGYRAIAYLVYILKLPRQFTVIFMNVISLTNISVYIKKNSEDWSLSLLLFMPLFFLFDMHAARTAVSISICALGYKYIKEKNLVKYIICVMIGCMFHSVAVISILAYFISYKRITLKTGLIVLMFEMAIIRFININTFLSHAFNLIHLNYFSEKILTYTTTKSDLYGYPMKLYDPRIWLGIVVFTAATVYICEKNDVVRFMTNGVWLYVFILILFSNTSMFAYRLSSFFYPYLIVLVPSIVTNFKIQKNLIGYNHGKRVGLFYTILSLFTVLNFAYAKVSMAEYVPFFVNGYGIPTY